MPKISDVYGIHDWNYKEYVLEWADLQDEEDRREQFKLRAEVMPFKKATPITSLD